jgi:hypothetical protein
LDLISYNEIAKVGSINTLGPKAILMPAYSFFSVSYSISTPAS